MLEQENVSESSESNVTQETTVEQESFERLVEKRLEKKYGDTIAELTNKITEFESAKEEQERAKRSKIENLESDLNKILTEKSTLESTVAALSAENMRTKWIYSNAPNELPQIYLDRVTGNNEEELAASLSEVVQMFESDFGKIGEKKQSIGHIPTETTTINIGGKAIADMTDEEYALWRKSKNIR